MIIEHPSTIIDNRLVGALRYFAAKAEQQGSLHEEQLSIIYQRNWFNLFVPKQYGGLELSLPDALKIEESLAWIDGALGWTVTLCSGANWFAGFIDKEIAQLIFNKEKVCLGGSGKPSGIAKMVDGGYEITGHWSYATGAAHVTVFTANCVIEKDGVVLMHEDGTPKVKAFLLMRDEVAIIEDWKYTGMKATSSYSFEVKALKVADNRSFILDQLYIVTPSPVYNFPFRSFAEATLAVNYSGMAIRFFELYIAIAANKTKQVSDEVKAGLEAIKDSFDLARQSFYATIQSSWDECMATNKVSEALLQAISTTSRAMAASSRKLMAECYPYCGLAAAEEGSDINRLWRDFHTASQHPLLLYKF